MGTVFPLGRNLRLAGVAFLLWSVAYNLAAPLLPLFARELGASSVQLGIVAAVGFLGVPVLVLPISLLADRRGFRVALLAGWCLSAAGVLLMAFAGSWSGLLPGAFGSLAVLAALPSLNAMVLEEAPPNQRARSFALLYSAGPLGLLVGSALGGLIAEAFGLRMVVAVAGVCSSMAVLALLPVRPRPHEWTEVAAAEMEGHNGSGFWVKVGFAAVTAMGFLFVALPGNVTVLFLREVGQQSLTAAGLYSALLAAAQLAWSMLFSVWPRLPGYASLNLGASQLRLSASTLAAIALCLVANALFGLLLPLPARDAWIPALLLRGSQYTLQPLGSALLGDVITAGPHRTTRLTLFSAATAIGAMGAPVTAGWLYDRSPSFPFWVSGVASAAGALLLLVLLFRLPRVGPHPG